MRASFPADDARRVCEHLYDKLYATKVERTFDLLVQLCIRYGRRMMAYQVVRDDFGVLLVGQPFGPETVRAIGDMNGKPLLDLQRQGGRLAERRDAADGARGGSRSRTNASRLACRVQRARFPGFINPSETQTAFSDPPVGGFGCDGADAIS